VASLTLIAPGGCATCGTTEGFGVPLSDDLRAPAGLLLQMVTGSDDAIVGDGDARAIWNLLDEVAVDRKRFVEVRSDRYGEPDLVADHLFAQGDGFGGEVDALDWYGAWRPLDSLIACADEGVMCEVALGTDADALGMGEWSDGRPVALPVVVDGVLRGGGVECGRPPAQVEVARAVQECHVTTTTQPGVILRAGTMEGSGHVPSAVYPDRPHHRADSGLVDRGS